MNVRLDTYEGAQGDIGLPGTISRIVRPGVIDGITSADLGGDLTEFLFRASAAANNAALASPLRPEHAAFLLRRILIDSLSDTSAQVRLIYETTPYGGAPSTYLITDGSVMTSYQTYTMPDTYEEIRVGWTAPPDGTESDFFDGDTIKPDNIMFNFLRPMRTIKISGLIQGQPGGQNGQIFGSSANSPGQEAVGSVNNASWPTAGPTPKGVGYWLLNLWQTTISRIGGYYTLEAEAITRIHSDWSEYGTLRDMKTGLYVPISTAERAAAVALPYSRGFHPYNGFVKVCPYFSASFSTIFGW